MAVEIKRERRSETAPPSVSSQPNGSSPAASRLDVTAAVSAHRWWILVGLIMAAALEILDTTVVNVALPQMSRQPGRDYG